MKILKYKIKGMMCSGCSNRVEDTVSQLDKIIDCKVNLEKAECIVKVENDFDFKEVIRVVESIGYGCELEK